MCELTGYSEKALLKKTIEEITHPEDWPREAAAMRQLATGEIEQYCADKRFIRKNREVAWGRLIATVRRDRSGKAFRRISVIQDIHEERMAREERFEKQDEMAVALLEAYFSNGLDVGNSKILAEIAATVHPSPPNSNSPSLLRASSNCSCWATVTSNSRSAMKPV
jgi:PAS domain S-box-containing protein